MPTWPFPDAVKPSCGELQVAPGPHHDVMKGLNFAELAVKSLPCGVEITWGAC